MPNTLALTNSAARRGDAVDVRHAGQTWKGVLGRWGAMFRGARGRWGCGARVQSDPSFGSLPV
jgi:hypothetical protein